MVPYLADQREEAIGRPSQAEGLITPAMGLRQGLTQPAARLLPEFSLSLGLLLLLSHRASRPLLDSGAVDDGLRGRGVCSGGPCARLSRRPCATPVSPWHSC